MVDEMEMMDQLDGHRGESEEKTFDILCKNLGEIVFIMEDKGEDEQKCIDNWKSLGDEASKIPELVDWLFVKKNATEAKSTWTDFEERNKEKLMNELRKDEDLAELINFHMKKK